MIKLVAITGKMGSGKSEVLKIFKDKGYCTLSADQIYNELLKDEQFVREISSALNVEMKIINGEARLDKKAISNLVFNDQEKLKILNGVTHPKIMQELLLRAKEFNSLTICEIPLLQGSGYEQYFSTVIEVKREQEKCLQGASERDNLSEKEVLSRQKFQPEYEKKRGTAHIIIYNNGTKQHLYDMVSAVESKI